jgi:predicted ATPase/class 3 adenylate cyclase
MATDLPTGTVTFLFTDIEGSTRLLQRLGERYRAIQDRHAEVMRTAIRPEGGHEVRTEGDSFFVTFPTPAGAVRAAVAAQRALHAEPWPHGDELRVRMGLHTGEGVAGGDDYLGIDVNRAARIAAVGHGGQVLISDATRALVHTSAPDGVAIRDLGTHRLKDLDHPEHLFDLVIAELPGEFPALRTLDARPTNLPVERTSFVGRHRELARIAELLTGTRLLTLTGPGGTGKTRLALKTAGDHLDRFDDGVFLAPLATVTDPELVPSAIATALRVREDPGRTILDSVVDHLRDRNVLLVLDNFEQVMGAAPMVDRLLDAAPDLAVLATSRIPLHLSGEQEFHVPPLALPDPEGIEDLTTLTACESVMLFAERAAAVLPGFRITEENARPVAAITGRLDGLPLALELAASRVKVLSVPELLERLDRRLPLLTGGSRDVPERQRTLRAAIEWSHDLLDVEERRLFARLTVFAGGWSLDAAEAVCGPGLDIDVLDGLSSLVDNSLVERRRTGDDESRFRMLETIRELAGERLAASGEGDETRGRHARYARDLAEEADSHLNRDEQAMWFRRLELEHDNLRAAMDWAERTGDADTAVRIASALWRFWQSRGHLAEGRARLERVLAMPGGQSRDAVRVRGLGGLGGTAYWQGDHSQAEAAYGEALDIARELGDRRLLAGALYDYSFVPRLKDDLDGTEAFLREGRAVAEEAGDRTLVGWATLFLGYVFSYRGDNETGLSLLREAVAIGREVENRVFLSEALSGQASVEFLMGDMPRAKQHFLDVVRLQMRAENLMGLSSALVPLSLIASREGRFQEAARLLGTTDRMREELGGGPPPTAFERFGDLAEEPRRALRDEAFQRAWAEGRAMSLDEAVAMALEGDSEDG